MLGLPLAFSAPLLLTAFLALPLLWVLLRVSPPRPRAVAFPPTRLLLEIRPKEESATRTPWWLTALRLLLAALVILAAAGPVWNPPAEPSAVTGPLILVIDQGWPAAATWSERQTAAGALIDDAEKAGRGVALIPTGDVPRTATLLSPAAARDRLRALAPVPYAPARDDAFALAATMRAANPEAGLVFLSDGVDMGADGDLAAVLAPLKNDAARIISGGAAVPLALAGPVNGADSLTVTVLRPASGAAHSGRAVAKDMRGLTLAETAFTFPEGTLATEARFILPVEIRNDIARIDIAGEPSAGAVQLIDKSWRRRTVGIVSGTSTDLGQPLLAPTYYLTRALAPYADLRVAETGSAIENIDRFLEQRLPVLLLPDVGTIPPATRARLSRFVADGGVLVRFAGPRLANAPAETQDDLLPVKLRRGGRVLGGSLSWDTPQPLGTLPPEGPFRDLKVPADVTVNRQVLAEPDGALGARTWAALKDGTPLVTGTRIGRGELVLVHVTADTSWSNLPLSGIFVDMLRRVIALSDTPPADTPADAIHGADAPDVASLAPARVLDGFGAFTAPGPAAHAITAGFAGRAGADHPPGFYGPPDSLVAVNVLLPDDAPKAIDFAAFGIASAPLQSHAPRDLTGALLIAAMALLLIDTLAVFHLGGGFARLRGRRTRAALLLAALALGGLALPRPAAADSDAFALQAAGQTRLAYVRTGHGEVDDISEAGLSALAAFLGQRTALQAGDSMGVDLDRDELAFFPIIYWPILPDTPVPAPAVLARLDAYMKQGGTVIFDTRDAIEAAGVSGAVPTPAAAKLRQILAGLDIPELTPVPYDHVLTKAFYLLMDFPGRFTGGTTWVEAMPPADDTDRPARAGDGVSPVIITANDLAGAWAVSRAGEPLLPLTPGEPRQREMAFRAGANMVMYVLTGNYKADQVHVPALLERLGQ